MDPIFISYARRQRALAGEIHALLGGNAADVFLDTEGVEGGADWVHRIGERLARAGRLVVLVSPDSLASDWVRNELSTWLARHADFLRLGRVIPVLVGYDLPLPTWLTAAQHVDLAAPEGVGRLRDAAKRPGDRRLLAVPPDELAGLRPDLNRHLGALLIRKPNRRALEGALALPANTLENWGGEVLTANAALVRASTELGPVAGARRLLDALSDAFDAADLPWLDGLRARLPAPSADEDPVLVAWRAAVAADHRELVDVFRKGARVEVDEVYVEPAFAGDEPRLDTRTRTLRALLTTPPEGATGRWVVKGEPGSGKTTLLRHLAWSLAQERDPLVPIFASLPSLLRYDSDLVRRAERRLRHAGVSGLGASLEALGRAGRLVLLLDGLDEVPTTERATAVADLRAYSSRWPEARLVVTSRPLGFVSLGSDWRELRLLPFDEARQRAFLTRWFDAPRATALLARLGREVAELASNPLYLTLVALLVEHGAEPSHHRAVLYDQVFELLLRGLHRVAAGEDPRDSATRHPEVVAAALREIGLGMTQANVDAASQGDIEALLDRATREHAERCYHRYDRLDGLWDDLTRRMGVLGPYADDPNMWRWWHRSFREAWAARALHHRVLVKGGAPASVRESLCDPKRIAGAAASVSAERARWEQAGLATAIDHARLVAGAEGQWAEPFALLAGRLAEPDDLLTALTEGNPALARRSLSSARQVSAEVVARILDLGGDPDARRDAFLTVPAKVGDPERAIDLLARLAQETTDPDDLWFLDLALERVGEGAPALGPGVAKARSQLYDHLPDPVGMELDAKLWNGAAMWARVPAGVVRPRGGRPIRLEAPLRVLAVPVTNRMWATFQPGWRPTWPEVPEAERRDHPVVNVSWFAAVSFCRWLGKRVAGARLPTEAEWEYACRAGTTGDWWCAEEGLPKVAWLYTNSGRRTHRVGELCANPSGLYDVHGNVWEWTADRWDAVEGTPRGKRVIRGGFWGNDAVWCRSAFRNKDDADGRGDDLGFRVVLPAPREG